jgi:hypothetical protein
MRRIRHLLAAAFLLGLLPLISHPAGAQNNLGFDILSTRRELSGQMWGTGHWIAFCVEEDGRDLNRDGDDRDTILCVADLRTMTVHETGIAIEYGLSDDDEAWPVATSDDLIAVVMNEADNGGKDLNGNGTTTDDVLAIYNPSTRQRTVVGVDARNPVFLNNKVYFQQSEAVARKDLNGDGDARDVVLSVYDPATRQVESLGMECAMGFLAAGDWLLTRTSEAAQGNRDLNGDRDNQDEVAQLYQISQKKWINTTLESSFDVALTPKLAIVGVDERKQGNKDLNGDGDMLDVVAHIWDLTIADADPVAHIINTGQDCSGGVDADGGIAAFVTAEAAQGNKDLNMDQDTEDDVAQAFILAEKKVVNIGRDASGGIAVGAEKVAFVCSEIGQGDKDLNGDKDADDDVLLIYDPSANKVVNIGYAVDGDLACAEGTLGWRVLEQDQFDRDLNRDGDTDDSIVFLMDLNRGRFGSTGHAGGEYLHVNARGAGFAVLELDQGERDLNNDKDLDDEVMHIARIKR